MGLLESASLLLIQFPAFVFSLVDSDWSETMWEKGL